MSSSSDRNEIVLREADPLLEQRDPMELAQQMVASGLFKDTRNAEQAFVKILAGREMGIPAFAAMRGVHVIQGTPQIGAHLLAARIKQSGKYTYRVREHADDRCRIEFFERDDNGEWELIGESVFTMADAKRAKLDNKDNYRGHPRDMMFARALSKGARTHCPDLFGGSVYVEGETEGPIGGDQPRRRNPLQAVRERRTTVEVVEEPPADAEDASEPSPADRFLAAAERASAAGIKVARVVKEGWDCKPAELNDQQMEQATAKLEELIAAAEAGSDDDDDPAVYAAARDRCESALQNAVRLGVFASDEAAEAWVVDEFGWPARELNAEGLNEVAAAAEAKIAEVSR